MIHSKSTAYLLQSLINVKLAAACICLFILSGCIYNDEPMPKITYDYNTEIFQPKFVKPVPKPQNFPADWKRHVKTGKKWTAIVIHHSGTKNGNSAIFDKWHREGNHWEGVGYDFVIGNGTDSRDGQVEVTFRWRKQKTGAHCGGTPGNWANREAVGICLVGNFNNTVPTSRQMQSLAALINFLHSDYGIPKNRIYGHGTTPGCNTDCPGRNFPMAELKSSMLNF
ncbi:MAG: N-acetylmuramoyl-L-alanine amidase [Planctomycetes bacterium]|nr:N-acetylmuramoyl-L-alanine amidase [Planctomycetota bacterium]MCK5473080.1 N-acetylmuramoyl-L-alanine amidase [Planctomycetota bacterium]